MKTDILPKEVLTDDELYPGQPPPRMKKEHAELTVEVMSRFTQIPGYHATAFLDIYEPHNPKVWRQPDVSVMKEGSTPPSGTLRLHKFPPPELVVEVTSEGTWATDHNEKVKIYLNWGIGYYLILDLVKAQVRVVDSKGRDVTYTDLSLPITVMPGLEIQWDGFSVDFNLWWEGNEILGIKDKNQALEEKDQALEEKDQALEENRKKIEAMRKKLEAAGIQWDEESEV